MQFHFTGRNIDVTPALKTFTEEKLQRLLHRDASINNIHVSYHVENLTQTVEATVHVPGTEIHASASADDMYAAIDELTDKLMHLVTKHKEKHSS